MLHVTDKDVLEQVFKQVLDAASKHVPEGENEKVQVIMRVVEALIGVKKGGRIPSKHVASLRTFLSPADFSCR